MNSDRNFGKGIGDLLPVILCATRGASSWPAVCRGNLVESLRKQGILSPSAHPAASGQRGQAQGI